MKNAGKWLGPALAALIAVLAVIYWLRLPTAPELPQGEKPPQQTAIPDQSEPRTPEEPVDAAQDDVPDDARQDLPEDGAYTTRDDVALYIHLYGRLPSNFITKREAEKLGWPGGSLEPYAPGCCIGGDRFGNYEERLPVAEGRSYRECDIDTMGAERRGPKRIVYSNDGLIYYTDDHYEHFTLLYGEEDG